MNWELVWHQAVSCMWFQGRLLGRKKTWGFHFPCNIAGDQIRLHFSNRCGKKAYRISTATVTVNGRVYDMLPGGRLEVKPGKGAYTDAVCVDIPAGGEILVRFYSEDYIADYNLTEEWSNNVKGDLTKAPIFPEHQKSKMEQKRMTFPALPALDSVEVYSGTKMRKIVAFGDSITAMNRWVKPLQARLEQFRPGKYFLVNSGISGNGMIFQPKGALGAMYGAPGEKRAEWDCFRFENLHAVILALGINDISNMKGKNLSANNLSRLKQSVERFCRKCREKGVRIVVQTVTPALGNSQGFSAEMEQMRQEYNQWLRSCGLFDYVVDVDACLSDENGCVKEGLHQGDHIHPSAEGGRKMAQAYDLEKLVGEKEEENGK